MGQFSARAPRPARRRTTQRRARGTVQAARPNPEWVQAVRQVMILVRIMSVCVGFVFIALVVAVLNTRSIE